jgi:glyoxylase-like metal-dependent hydrolase (beta-lactamase superfamily II)
MTANAPEAVPRYTHLEHGITVIDTGYARPGYDAAYLVVESGRAAFIDTGVNASVPRLLAALDERGLTRDAVDWVLLTHVHLDHAGGAGTLMAALPNARLGVHPRGVRHMADPGALMQAVRAVYGDAFTEQEYGSLLPIPPARIETLAEGAEILLAGRRFVAIDSPGHARHHLCYWDETSRGWFTGDAFGLCLRELHTADGPTVLPTTSPSQFDPLAFHDTVARLLARHPRAVYPTHFGEVLHPERLAPHLLALVDAQAAAARAVGQGVDGVARMREAFAALYLHALHAQGWRGDDAQLRAALGADLDLNAEGSRIWLAAART